MRVETKEICDLLDHAADLVEQEKLNEAQNLLQTIAKLMEQWVERYLSPCEKSGL